MTRSQNALAFSRLGDGQFPVIASAQANKMIAGQNDKKQTGTVGKFPAAVLPLAAPTAIRYDFIIIFLLILFNIFLNLISRRAKCFPR